jgi:carbon-monoxide dehydrogenase large subunit
LVPFAARHCGRPVKWTEDRREHLMTINHAREAACDIEIACARDGTVLGLRGHVFVDMGAYMRTNGAIGARNIPQFMSGPYRVPNIDIDSTLLLTNKTPVGTYRGPGRFETDFVRERLFEMAARDLGIDPVEFRRHNLVRDAEMPYQLASIAPFPSSDELDSGDYQVTLDRCLKEIGWAEKAALRGRCIDGCYHGLAVACFIEGGAAGPKETARLVLEQDGTLTVYLGSSGVGQGLETAFAQITADAMAMPMERINRVLHGSTTYVSDGYGAYHSRSIVMGGSAVLDAATKLQGMMRAEAARRLNCGADEVVLADERAAAPDGKSVSWAELAAEPMSVEGTFLNKKHTWAYGAHAAHVTVDPKTGAVTLLDYVAVENCGRMINPLTLKGQLVGAVVQGLGGTFLEHLAYDDNGQLLTGSLADYLVPTASDFPKIRGYMMESHPSPINPLGAKGAGEGGVISVGGVMSNAIADALSSLGVEPRDLPLSPPMVWQLIQDARK